MKNVNLIKSDIPEEHWPNVNVLNKNVLDLGCGVWLYENQPQHNNTPKYFLKQGAENVIGVDKSFCFVDFYKKLKIPNFQLYNKKISSFEDIRFFIKKHNINIIKSDIEGSEIVFLESKLEDYSDIYEVYIEYHSYDIRDSLLDHFKNLNFKSIDIGQFSFIDQKYLLPYGVIYFYNNCKL
jgi:SAM-dependent methyltransferase